MTNNHVDMFSHTNQKPNQHTHDLEAKPRIQITRSCIGIVVNLLAGYIIISLTSKEFLFLTTMSYMCMDLNLLKSIGREIR